MALQAIFKALMTTFQTRQTASHSAAPSQGARFVFELIPEAEAAQSRQK
jgi:hypothetical protein